MTQPRTDRTSSGSILSGVYGALTRVFGGLWTRYGGWGWSRIRLFLPGARKDWEREAGDTWMSPIVALGLAWLGDRFPRPRIGLARIARNGDRVPLPRHDVVDLWNRPNAYYSRRTMEKAIGLSLKCDGNAYIYKVRDNLGRVAELWWIPHYRILPTWPADGSRYIDGYRVWLDTAIYHLPPEDVIHVRDGIDPRNERLGLSALRACLREVCSDNLVSGYTASLMLNSGIPGVVIMPDGENGPRPDAATAERMADRWADEFGGDNAGRLLVSPGRYKIEKLGFSPEELALDRLPVHAQARIASSVGVAAMVLGLPDPNKTYSNLESAERVSWGTVVSIQELIAEAIQFGLLPEFGLDPHAYVFTYDYAHIQELQESLDAIHTRAREDWKAGGVRLNEYREAIGYEPDPDGDRFFPGTGSEADAAAKEQEAALGAPTAGDDDGDQEGDEKRLPFTLTHRNGCCGGRADFKGDYSLPPHPAEYPATVAAFDLYLSDLRAFPGEPAVDDLAGWLTKYNHCHGPDGRFCSGRGGHGHGGHGGGGGAAAKPAGGGGGEGGAAAKPAGGGGGGPAVDVGDKPAKEIDAHSQSMSADWRKGLSESEHHAVRTYTGEAYSAINSGLRGPKGAAELKKPLVKDLDRAIGRSSLKEPTVVYRGVSDLSKLGIDPAKSVGATFSDSAYMSTSINSKLAGKYAGKTGAVLKITAPKGAKGASMGGISRWPKEHEVLFARGSGIKITKITKQKNGQHLVEAELVQ